MEELLLHSLEVPSSYVLGDHKLYITMALRGSIIYKPKKSKVICIYHVYKSTKLIRLIIL